MKKTLGLLFTAFLCAAGLPTLYGQEAIVKIRTIRFIINEVRYDWTETSGLSSETNPGATRPQTLASFTELKPGMRCVQSELDRKLAELEHRLAESGFFMSQSVMAVPSQAEEGSVLVLVTVTDGFRWLFGGGSIYAVAGMLNAGGARRSWLAAAGYNLAGIRYTDELVAGKNLVAGAELFYQNGFGYSELTFDSIYAKMTLGARLHPDFNINIDCSLRWQNSSMTAAYASWFPSGDMLTLKPGLSMGLDYFAGNRIVTVYGSAQVSGNLLRYVSGIEAFQATVSASDVFTGTGTAFAVVGTPWFALSAGGKVFWNSGSKDFLETESLAPSQEYAIRAPVALSQVNPDMSFITTAELRSPALTLPLGGIFNFTTYFFIFDDFAWCARPYRDTDAAPTLLEGAVPEDGPSYWLNAAGAGIRFGFGYPINVLFTLTYGFNRLGQPALYLTSIRGF